VEVKIGVQHAPRELVLESALTLEDEKGRRVVVPVTKLAYVEIAENNQRRVGFGAV
jgi:hypothetical protein